MREESTELSSSPKAAIYQYGLRKGTLKQHKTRYSLSKKRRKQTDQIFYTKKKMLCFFLQMTIRLCLTSNSRSCGSSSESGITVIFVILYTLCSAGNKPTSAFWRIRIRPRGKSAGERKGVRHAWRVPYIPHPVTASFPSYREMRNGWPALMSHSCEKCSQWIRRLHRHFNKMWISQDFRRQVRNKRRQYMLL